MIGLPEILIVLVIILLLVGPKKLPALAKSLGQATKEYKRAAEPASRKKKKVEKPAG